MVYGLVGYKWALMMSYGQELFAPMVGQGTVWRVVLNEEGKSGQMGTAVLTGMAGKTKVTLYVSGGTKGVAQPAHIHVGVCPGVGAVKYGLNSVVDGKSETVLNVNIGDFRKMGPLAVNVHKSAAQVGVYVACGELK